MLYTVFGLCQRTVPVAPLGRTAAVGQASRFNRTRSGAIVALPMLSVATMIRFADAVGLHCSISIGRDQAAAVLSSSLASIVGAVRQPSAKRSRQLPSQRWSILWSRTVRKPFTDAESKTNYSAKCTGTPKALVHKCMCLRSVESVALQRLPAVLHSVYTEFGLLHRHRRRNSDNARGSTSRCASSPSQPRRSLCGTRRRSRAPRL